MEQDIEDIKAKVSGIASNLGIETPNTAIELNQPNKVSPEKFEADNEIKRSFKTDFDNYVNFAHLQMQRITIINKDTARDIDIENMRMEQLKAMRLKRIG